MSKQTEIGSRESRTTTWNYRGMDIALRNYSPNSENREKWSGSVTLLIC